MRIGLLCYSIGPYHLARYRALKDLFQDLQVIQLYESQSLYPWKTDIVNEDYKITTLFLNSHLKSVDIYQKKLLKGCLETIDPDVVISVGYSEKLMRAATAWARQNRRISIMMTDTWEGDKKRHRVKEIAKSAWCKKMYDGLFISGTRSYEYFKELGVSEDKIWRGVDVVDNSHFRIKASEARDKDDEWRRRYGLPREYLLCVARLSKEKNLVRLLEAFRIYRDLGGKWDLLICGDGPLRNTLADRTSRIPAGARINGWVQYEDLPYYYGLAKAFVLPSISEPWGLVVNEAMAAGLPLLVSRQCGCLPELCWRGLNGYDFDPREPWQLAELMIKLRSLELGEMGKLSTRIIDLFSPSSWASTLRQCILSALK
jgi:1,2-diacylglycerol 3-alpha-glucosyltransferase